MKNNFKILEEICEIPSVSGSEFKLMNYMKEKLIEFNFNSRKTALNNHIFTRNSFDKSKKTIAIDIHVDEIGLKVTKIDKKGYIHFEEIGGISDLSLINQRVNIWSDDLKRKIQGTIVNSKSVYNDNNLNTNYLPKLLIDIGNLNNSTLSKMNIKSSSSITFATTLFDNGDTVISKSLDNKLSLQLLLDFLESNNKDYKNFNLAIVLTTQEEVGLRGARTSYYDFNPDLVIVIDNSPIKNDSGSLGNGVMLRHKDATTLYDPKIVQYLERILIENKIKYQNYHSFGGTDAGIIHINKSGTKVIPLGILIKNIHTPSSIFNKNDYFDTLKFLSLLLTELDKNNLDI